MSDLFEDITETGKKLTAHKVGKNTTEGLPGKYARGARDVDAIPVEDNYIVPARTLSPAADYVYGVDKQRSGILPGPYYLGAPTVQNYGTHRPIWRGWRPKRPETDYPALGKEMMIPERNYKIESGFEIPDQKEIIDMAMRNALAPYPTTSPTDMIPDPYRTSFMDVRKKKNGTYLGMADLGLDVVTEADLSSSNRAPTTTNKSGDVFGIDFGGIAKDILSIFVPKPAAPGTTAPPAQAGVTYIMPPAQAGPEIPWGTIAVAGVLGLAAIIILPKVLK